MGIMGHRLRQFAINTAVYDMPNTGVIHCFLYVEVLFPAFIPMDV